MARRVTHNGGQDKPLDDDEQCPVCQSRSYLNRNMRFLMSTECYHKMCESCVERILQRGAQRCPVSGCQVMLRRHKFRAPTFADLNLEKEVDIRRMMGKIFNRREDDFESLRAYNDYLAEVEDLTFNLINGLDVAETQAKIDEYRRINTRTIEQNRELEGEGARAFVASQKAEKETLMLKRQAARQEEDKERLEQQAAEQEYLERLAAGGNADELAQKRKVKLQHAADRRKAAIDALSNMNKNQPGFLKGLKKRIKDDAEPAYDPFGGCLGMKEYFSVCADYPADHTFDHFKKTPAMNAGGYDRQEYYRRALCDAFAGLGVFVMDERAREDVDMSTEVALAAEDTAVG